MKKIFAFTLAEVLIALTIIGVVAALVVPTMIQNYQEKATVAKLRTVYSTLNQAFYMAKTEHGSPDTWDLGAGDGPSAVNVFRQYFKPYLKVQKDCGIGQGCWYDGMIKSIQGTDCINFDTNTGRTKALLADGTSLGTWYYENCNTVIGDSNALQRVCGAIHVDINGKNSPNAWGKDVFGFWITAEGVIPHGTSVDNTWFPLYLRCNVNSTYSYNGEGCAGWVIEKGNMDYLRKEVSW